MIINKEESISTLLKNFINSQPAVEIAFLYSRQGLLISKYGKLSLEGGAIKTDEVEQVHGAIASLVESLISKISLEYKSGHFGTGSFDTPDNRIASGPASRKFIRLSGSFDTPDNRIIFLEAGPDAILLCVCNYEANFNKIFPIAYLVVEKIAQLLEESFDYNHNSLEIPDLAINDNYSLNLDHHKVDDEVIGNIKLKHHIKLVENRKKNFKLIVLGSAAVGKTTLINSFLKKSQVRDYRPTLGISLSTQKYYVQGFKDDIISFLIYDLAGQEFFKRVRHEYYYGAHCVFVVYDITRKETFDEAIDFWFKDARDELGDIPIVLIGNKIDLGEKRQVSKQEGLEKAEELRSFFIETSALKNINVQDTFKLIGIGLFFKTFEEVERLNINK